jgi:hypothetical protein
MPKQSRISPTANDEVQAAFKAYADAVRASELSATTQGMYVDIASNFLRWLEYEYDPQAWIARYPVKKTLSTPDKSTGT